MHTDRRGDYGSRTDTKYLPPVHVLLTLLKVADSWSPRVKTPLSAWPLNACRLLTQNRLLQVSQGEPLQARVVLSAELERVAEDVDELDLASPSSLFLDPFLVHAYCNVHAILTLAIRVDVAHLEGADGSLLILDLSYQLRLASFRCRLLLVAVVDEAPGECGRVVGQIYCVVLGDVSEALPME
jgi:hypothetical protein